MRLLARIANGEAGKWPRLPIQRWSVVHRSRMPRARATRLRCRRSPTSPAGAVARARRARRRAERLLSARLGIGGERLRARPHRRLRARRVERCLSPRLAGADRPDAGRLAVARLQDSPARAGQRAIPMARFARRCSIATSPRMPRQRLCGRRADAGAHALILRDMSLDGAAMKAFDGSAAARRHAAARAAIPCPRLPRRDARRRRIAARGAGREEAERTAPPAQPPRRTRRRPFRRRAHARRRRRRARNLPDAGSQRLEGQARHRAGAGSRRCGLHPPRHRGARRDRPMRDRDPARRRHAGRGRRSCCGIRTARSISSSASTSALRNSRRACS